MFGNIFTVKIKQTLAVKLQALLNAPVIELDTIDSTNNYAKGLVKEGLAKDGMLIFAEEQTQRDLGFFVIPASLFQSLNSAFVVGFAPLFAWLWVKLNAMNKQPDAPIKILFGMLLTSIGFLFLIFVLGVFLLRRWCLWRLGDAV